MKQRLPLKQGRTPNGYSTNQSNTRTINSHAIRKYKSTMNIGVLLNNNYRTQTEFRVRHDRERFLVNGIMIKRKTNRKKVGGVALGVKVWQIDSVIKCIKQHGGVKRRRCWFSARRCQLSFSHFPKLDTFLKQIRPIKQ